METADKVKILQEVVRIPSVNGREEEVADYLAEVLADYGIASEKVMYDDGRANLVVTIENGPGKTLGLSGHLDVVAAGDEALWVHPPFAAVIEDGKLYGRGATDMKAGLVALVMALIELKEADLPFKGTVKLLATVGEEVGELGAEQLTQKGYVDDLDALVIAEPGNKNLIYTHKGSINYTVTATGREAHSSMPDAGVNAIDQLSDFIQHVNQEMAAIHDRYDNDVLGRHTHAVTIIRGGDQVNSIPGTASLSGNIRTIPEFNNEQTVELLEELIATLNEKDDQQLKLTIDFDKQPVESDPNSEIIQTIQRQFDEPLPVIGITPTTDAAEFTKSKTPFDVVIFGPGEPELPHQVNEFVRVDNYLEFIEYFKQMICDYLAE